MRMDLLVCPSQKWFVIKHNSCQGLLRATVSKVQTDLYFLLSVQWEV